MANAFGLLRRKVTVEFQVSRSRREVGPYPTPNVVKSRSDCWREPVLLGRSSQVSSLHHIGEEKNVHFCAGTPDCGGAGIPAANCCKILKQPADSAAGFGIVVFVKAGMPPPGTRAGART